MTTSLTEHKPQVIELSERAFGTFCNDISCMFDVDMKCSQQEHSSGTIKDLEKHLGKLAAVTTVKAEGIMNGTFQFVCDQQGLFILAGVIIMQPEQMIWENIKSGSSEKARDMSIVFAEVGMALVGAWDRVLRKELDGHGSLKYINTFIGNPWDKPDEKINLSSNEEQDFVTYQMKNGPYPPFKYGVIFPKELFNEASIATSDQLAEERQDSKITGETAEEKDSDIREEENVSADSDKDEKHPISKEIRKMTMSAVSSKEKESAQPERHQELTIHAKDIMQKDVLWGAEDDNVQETLAKIQQHGVGYVVVGRDKVPQGIVSESDLTAALSPYLQPEFAKWRKPSDKASLKIKIKWIMSSPVNTINLQTPLVEIMEKMCESGRRALPVVDQQGKIQGLVTVFDIFKGLVKHF